MTTANPRQRRWSDTRRATEATRTWGPQSEGPRTRRRPAQRFPTARSKPLGAMARARLRRAPASSRRNEPGMRAAANQGLPTGCATDAG